MRYFTLILIALSAAPSFAQGPRVDRLERPGGQRGTEFTVVAHGELLGEVNNVLFYDEGLSLKKVEATDDASAAMTIAVGSDVLPGEYPLRLLSPSGVSDLKTLHISPYPQSQEAEPNNSMEEAQSVELGTEDLSARKVIEIHREMLAIKPTIDELGELLQRLLECAGKVTALHQVKVSRECSLDRLPQADQQFGVGQQLRHAICRRPQHCGHPR